MRVILDVASDFHGFHGVSKAALALHCAHLMHNKPNRYIFNGDLVEFEQVSRFGASGREAPSTILAEASETVVGIIIPVLAALDYKIRWHWEDVDPGDPVLKNVKRVCIDSCVNTRGVNVHWIEGNHETRIKTRLRLMETAFQGLISMSKVFCLNELGIDFVHSTTTEGNGILHLSPTLAAMHGNKAGVTAAKRTLDAFKGSVIVGHNHKQGMDRQTSNTTGRDWLCIVSGCMSESPTFNSTPNYNRGFISGWYDDQPPYRFDLHHCNIISDGNHLPDDPACYPRRVQEPDHSVLVTPWGEYKAMENAAGIWSVTQTWRKTLCGSIHAPAAPAPKCQRGKIQQNENPRRTAAIR